MKVAIIGAGFGGLAAAHKLSKAGVSVTVFESGELPGGLAVGFKEERWKWSIERHYHHWFMSDWVVRNLAKELGHEVIIKRPKTSTFIDGRIEQLDSPFNLLKFSKLPVIDRIRTGFILGYLRLTPNWQSLEKLTAETFIKKYMGETSWNILWGPLFKGKFDKYVDEISAAWFWARIKKRSASLCYPEGGFLTFAQNLVNRIEKQGGKVIYNTIVEKIREEEIGFSIKTYDRLFRFDKVICTLPTPQFLEITNNLPRSYVNSLIELKGIGAVNLVLSLKKQFLTDDTYWLNIDKKQFPFLAVVEHTNFIDKKYYNNEHLIYIGNYLEHSHEYFKKNEGEIFYEFLPYLSKINPDFSEKWVNKYFLFKAFFAQPIYPLNYSGIVPSFETPLKGLYLCNIQQVYPWDRGTNYAVENAEKVADLVLQSG